MNISSLFNKNTVIRKSNVFKYLLISYIIVFLVPLLINIATYINVINVVKSETAEKNLIISEQLKTSAEQMLIRVENVKSLINENETLLKTNFTTENINSYERVELLKIISKLNSYKVSDSDFLEDIYLLRSDCNLAMGTNGLYTTERLYKTHFANTDIEYPQFLSMIEKSERIYKPYKEVSVDGISNNSIMCILPLESKFQDMGWDNLILTIPRTRFAREIKTVKEYPGTEIFIINKNNEFITLSGILRKVDITYSELLNEKNIFNKKLNGQNYMVTFLNSDITDWKYVMIIPASSYLDSTNSLKNILLLGWIIALFAGLFIIYKFTMRNYGEIKKIVNLFGEHKDIKNELEYINKNILESISTNEKLNKIISQVKDDKKDAYLRSILRGESLNSSIQKSEDIKNYFEYENYIVAAISVDKYENIFFEESIRNQSEKYYDAYFIIANTLSELLGAEIIRIDGIITAIINFPGNTGTEDILNTLKQAVEFYKEKFNLTVTISLGTIKFSEKEVNISYKEAQDALLYKFIYGTGSVIDYKLIEGLSGTVVYSLEKEQLIINYAKTGDFTEICNIINEIFDTNFKNKVVPVQIAKCFIFDVLNTILRILPKIDEDNEEIYLLDESSIIDEIMDSNTITEMKESILNVFKKICEYNGSVSANNAANLSKKIEQYIRLNFKNPDINVSIIADYFGLSGAYISKLFRIQTGISILDYIHKERIAVAKEMLKQGKIVAQVAAELGYNNSNAFIRVFKRYEKITPGQYCNHFGKGE